MTFFIKYILIYTYLYNYSIIMNIDKINNTSKNATNSLKHFGVALAIAWTLLANNTNAKWLESTPDFRNSQNTEFVSNKKDITPKDSIKTYEDWRIAKWSFDSKTWFLIKWTLKLKDNTILTGEFSKDIEWELIHGTKTTINKIEKWYFKDWNLINGTITHRNTFPYTKKRELKNCTYNEENKIIFGTITYENGTTKEGKFDPETGNLIEWTLTTWDWRITETGTFDHESWLLLKWIRRQNEEKINFNLNASWNNTFYWDLSRSGWAFMRGSFKLNKERHLQLHWKWTMTSDDGNTFTWIFENWNLIEWDIKYYNWVIDSWKFKNNILREGTSINKKWKETQIQNGKKITVKNQ